ncbi:MAG: hypothetical protein ACRECY_03285 [Phyllobacterium sp.]
MSAALTLSPKDAVHGYAKVTLKAVHHLPIEDQMEEIRLRILVGEYADVPEIELNVLRRIWQALFAQLYQFATVH